MLISPYESEIQTDYLGGWGSGNSIRSTHPSPQESVSVTIKPRNCQIMEYDICYRIPPV